MYRQVSLTLSILLTSAGLSGCSDELHEEVTEEVVDQAWTEAAECLTDQGYEVRKDRRGNSWSLEFGGEAEGVVFDLRYGNCVGDAEALTMKFLRTQIPEGAQRLELAAEFQDCLSSAGIPDPVGYDPTNPDSVAVLRDAIVKLGYSNDDPGVADDPRFGAVLRCFDTYELLFPDRFEN